jgi:HlyD family secretion protein
MTQVTRGSIERSVTAAGVVNPTSRIRASFKSAGRVTAILVVVGQTVEAGQPLAKLDVGDLSVALSQAEASLAGAEARYDQTVAGAAPEDVAIARQAVDNARRSFDEAQRTSQSDLAAAEQSLSSIEAAYGAAKINFATLTAALPSEIATLGTDVGALRTAIRRAVSDVERTPRQSADAVSARNFLLQADGAIGTAQTYLAGSVQVALNDYLAARDTLSGTATAFDASVQSGRSTASAGQDALVAQSAYANAAARLASALDALGAQLTAAQTATTSAQSALNNAGTRSDPDLDAARADVVALQDALAARQQTLSGIRSRLGQATSATSVITETVSGAYASAQRSVESIRERTNASVVNAQSALASAQASLAKAAGAPRSYDIAVTYAAVLSARSAVQKAQTDLDNATLRSPAAAVVAQVNNQVGEWVSVPSASPVIVLATTSGYTLHGSVGEGDVAQLAVGQPAVITIDALGARVTGKVTAIDPLATMRQGLPSYDVEVTLDGTNPQVRSGMNGTMSIAARKAGVLTVPTGAIHRDGTRRYVRVQRGERTESVDVTLGVIGAGAAEITAGLREGDLVVLPAPRAGGNGDQAVTLKAATPFAYSAVTASSLERMAVVVTVTNRSGDDLLVNPAEFLARDVDDYVYPANLAATAADASAVTLAGAPLGMRGIVPLGAVTLRKNDSVTGFVVFDVPVGVQLVELVHRQTDADRVVQLPAAP